MYAFSGTAAYPYTLHLIHALIYLLLFGIIGNSIVGNVFALIQLTPPKFVILITFARAIAKLAENRHLIESYLAPSLR